MDCNLKTPGNFFQVFPLFLEKITRNWPWFVLPLRKIIWFLSLDILGVFRVREKVFNLNCSTFFLPKTQKSPWQRPFRKFPTLEWTFCCNRVFYLWYNAQLKKKPIVWPQCIFDLLSRSNESQVPVEDFIVQQTVAGSGLMMRLRKEVIVMATMKITIRQQMEIL